MKTLGLVFGGISTESEISVITTCAAYRYITQCGYDIVPIYIDKSGKWYHVPSFNGKISDFTHLLKSGKGLYPITIIPGIGGLKLKIKKNRYQSDMFINLDILFPIMHGNGGEDGSIQGLAQMCGASVVGPDLFTAQWTMDKLKVKLLLKHWGYPVCDYMILTNETYIGYDLENIFHTLGKQVVVKPCSGGSSIGVAKCSNLDQLRQGIEVALNLDQYIIIEPYLEGYLEVCCAVSLIDSKIQASLIEDPGRGGEVLDFDDKYSPTGGSFTGTARIPKIPAELDASTTKAIRSTCESIYSDLGMTGTPRIDFLINRLNRKFSVAK